MILGVGLIGCGLIGGKRINAVSKLKSYFNLIGTFDIDPIRSSNLALQYGSIVFKSIDELLLCEDIHVIFVSTLHNALAEITLKAIFAGKHVFVEKPAAKNSNELIPLLAATSSTNLKIRVGFNHRYHKSVLKAKEIVKEGILGELMFIKASYGHGGRIGYEKEWRSNSMLSGGGELIDQGSHLIDLSRWFLGEFIEIKGFAHTYFWDMEVDDNAFIFLKNAYNQVAFLQASCTEWKNSFSMEVYGKKGKLHLSGLGGSYGLEKITHYNMLPQMGPPETICWEFPMADESWEKELLDFYYDIALDRKPSVGVSDAFEVLKVVKEIYIQSGYDHHS